MDILKKDKSVATQLSLEDILFGKNEVTGIEECVCPKCFVMYTTHLVECPACQNQTFKYDAETFFEQRAIFISLETAMTRERLKALYESQSESWRPILTSFIFLNKYSLTKIDLNDVCRNLLFNIPYKNEVLESFLALDTDFNLDVEDINAVCEKLDWIEKKNYFDVQRQFASLARLYVQFEPGEKTAEIFHWLMIVPGHYLSNGYLRYTEDKESELEIFKKIMPEIQGFYLKELAFFPLHWKWLIHQKLNSDVELISKKRYEILLNGIQTETAAEKAWKCLGLAYCSNDKDIAQSIQDYCEQHPEDFNFQMSYAIIFGKINSILFQVRALKGSHYHMLRDYFENYRSASGQSLNNLN